MAAARAPEATATERVSLAYPGLLTITECCPGWRLVKATGVTQLGSLFPSNSTCAPCGVESIVNWPAATTGAVVRFFAVCDFAGAAASATGVDALSGISAGWASG